MRLYPGIPLLTIPDRATRNALGVVDTFLRDASRALSENQPATESALGSAPNNATFLTLTNTASLSAERRLTATAPLTLTDNGANTTATLSFSASGLGGLPVSTYATTEAAGVASTFIRTDATLQFPQALMPASGGTDTLTLTQSGVDLTLTGSNSGILNIRPTSQLLSLPYWAGAGGNPPIEGSVLAFVSGTATVGPLLGENATLYLQASRNDGTAYVTKRMEGARILLSDVTTGGATFTDCDSIAGEFGFSAQASLTGTNNFLRRVAIEARMRGVGGSGTTVTDEFGIEVLSWPITMSPAGTHTNVAAGKFQMPSIGSTIRRGVWVPAQSTFAVGTDPTDAEHFYSGAVIRGTGTRSSFAFEGHTSNSATTTYGIRQTTAHTVGTTRLGMSLMNAGVVQNPSGISQNVLTLDQLNTGATAGAHILLNDKAGDPTGLTAGQFWRNATKLKFYEGTLTHDLNPLTTKGDIIVHNGTTEVRLPVGTDGQQLEADSTQASGLKWAAAGGSASSEFADDVFRIIGSGGETTKKLAWEVNGITAATTRTRTALDADGTEVLIIGGAIADSTNLRPGFHIANITGTNSVNVVQARAATTGNAATLQPFANGTGDTSVGLHLSALGANGEITMTTAGVSAHYPLHTGSIAHHFFAGAMA